MLSQKKSIEQAKLARGPWSSHLFAPKMRKAPVLDTLRLHFPPPLIENDMSTFDLTALLDHLEYWPNSQQFTWRRSPCKRIRVNSPAGHRTPHGVLVIGFRGKQYKVADLIAGLNDRCLTARPCCR